nr:septum formation initiator [Campylobacter sp.]
MNEILEEAFGEKKKKKFNIFSFYPIAVLLVVILGIYIGNMVFGPRGLLIMFDLENQRSDLKNIVSRLQNQNAALQKEYFELIGLDPDSYK